MLKQSRNEGPLQAQGPAPSKVFSCGHAGSSTRSGQPRPSSTMRFGPRGGKRHSSRPHRSR